MNKIIKNTKRIIERIRSSMPKANAKLKRMRDNKVKLAIEKIDNFLGETKTSKAFNHASNPDIDLVRNNKIKENAKKKSLQAEKRIESLRQNKNSSLRVVKKSNNRKSIQNYHPASKKTQPLLTTDTLSRKQKTAMAATPESVAAMKKRSSPLGMKR